MPLDPISQSQTQHEVPANANFGAVYPAATLAKHDSLCGGLTFAFYGGRLSNSVTVADGTGTNANNATNYWECTTAGVVSTNTSAFTSGRIRMYIGVAASGVVTYTDVRVPGLGLAPSGAVPSGTGFTHNTSGAQDGASVTVDLAASSGHTTATGDISANTHKITSVVDPTSAQDAATKAYVDAQAQGISLLRESYRFYLPEPSTTTAVLGGFQPSGTVTSGGSMASTSLLKSITRNIISSTASANTGTTLDLQTYVYWTGNATGLGGFRVMFLVGVETTGATMRYIAGLSVSGLNLTVTEPSSKLSVIGAACDSTDSNLQIMHSNASGPATKIDLGSNFPARTANAVYRVTFTCPPDSTTISYTVERLDSAFTATGSFS